MKSILSLLAVLVLLTGVHADKFSRQQRRAQRQGWSQSQQGWTVVQEYAPVPAPVVTAPPGQKTTLEEANKSTQGSADAMGEVNAKRAAKGLPPLIADPLLSQGAYECAKRRASRHIHGHLPESDFSCLPAGAHATVGGAGALEDFWGWETCAYDSTQYTVGGAAWVRGSDGRRYMSFFGR